MPIKDFFNDLLGQLAKGGGTIVPAEAITPATTPAVTPAEGDTGGDVDADLVGDEGVSQGGPNETLPSVAKNSEVLPVEDGDDGTDEVEDTADDAAGDADEVEGTDAADDADDKQELDADALARRLHAALVQLDGRVSNPDAVPFDPAHLDGDGAALTAAIDGLVEQNPAIRSRQYGGDIGAGSRGATPRPPVDLIQLMRDA